MKKQPETFAEFVQAHIDRGYGGELAGEFKVPLSMIKEWGSGASRPEELIQKLIVEAIHKRFTQP